MRRISSVTDLPNEPAIYALIGGKGRGQHVAYIGMADQLKARIEQHLVRHDSSVTTGTTTVMLNPNLVAEVRWWTEESFSERAVLEAAELVAFEVMDPALRSRGNVSRQAKIYFSDEQFRRRYKEVFLSEPKGILHLPTLKDAFEQIELLEKRVAFLEEKISQLTE